MYWFDKLDRYDQSLAMQTEEDSVTYAEMLAMGESLVCGLPTRSLAFLVCKNACKSIAAYVALLRKRIVPVLISHEMDRGLFTALVGTYQPYAIIAPKNHSGESDSDEYDVSLTQYGMSFQFADDLGLLLTTSGSTGSPKLVRQTYDNISSNTASIIEYLGIGSDERCITTMPMSYTYGLSIINTHLAAGASIFVTEKSYFDQDFWGIFKKYGITSFGAVPYTYEILKRLAFFEKELPSLRYATQAGGKLERSLHLEFAEHFQKKGQKFVIMYGATEATARMSYLPTENSVEKAGSIGVAIPGGRFELIDADGAVIDAPDTVGELVYYGSNVTPGYAVCPADLSKEDERKGRLETGDMAKRDSDGFYYIVGRKSRFLKMFGNRVNLQEVEGLLREQGWESACTGKDNEMHIFTICNDKPAVSSYLASKMKLNPSAFVVHSLDKIPRTEAGKIQYAELDKLWRA